LGLSHKKIEAAQMMRRPDLLKIAPPSTQRTQVAATVPEMLAEMTPQPGGA
jgi:hypothetical protein